MKTSDHRGAVQRSLTWYSRVDDRLVGERPVQEIGIEQLKAVFRPPEEDPLMYDAYRVDKEAAKFLGQALSITLDLEHFDYFVECSATDPYIEGTIGPNERRLFTGYWALKTSSRATNESYWDDFRRERVIAIGWSRIRVDPSKVSPQELTEAIAQAYPERTNHSRDAKKLLKFVNLTGQDLVLLCDGYAPNTAGPVPVCGFARVTGPFRDDQASRWRWRFTHDADIMVVEKDIRIQDLKRALGKGSLMEAIHELDQASVDRVLRLLGLPSSESLFPTR